MKKILTKIVLVTLLIWHPIITCSAQTADTKGGVHETVIIQLGDDLYEYSISSDYLELVDQYKKLLSAYADSETILDKYIISYGELSDAISDSTRDSLDIIEPAIEDAKETNNTISETRIDVIDTIDSINKENSLITSMSFGIMYSKEDDLFSFNILGSLIKNSFVGKSFYIK